MPTFDKLSKQLINAARRLGGRGIPIYLEDEELLRLCAVAAADLGRSDLAQGISPGEPAKGYFGTALEWFSRPDPEPADFAEVFLSLRAEIEDFATYFKCLCELHKRRRKYESVLMSQVIPSIESIVPRCLLEYGMRPNDALASWMMWRKWLYDIDNRAAQETGYLFEPILTEALGGTSYGHANSPIRRTSDPTKGRQADCIDAKSAYEFKLRVTIAASGQGRFEEELDFARDCRTSGYTPILLVLDRTPSHRLDELVAEYAKFGGTAYVGPNAWKHIEEKAGGVMGRFVEKYVRLPLADIGEGRGKLLPLTISDVGISITVGLGDRMFEIARAAPSEDTADEKEVDGSG